MKSFLQNNPLARFLIIALSTYVAWLIVYEAIMPEMKVKDDFDARISRIAADSGSAVLNLFGFNSFRMEEGEYIIVGIHEEDSDSSGVHIGPQCNGVSLFALFLIYVLAFPGPWKKKAWFIPLGVLAIHLINSIRIALLAYIQKDYPEYLDLNHNYTFQIIVYGFVFFLWYLWTSRLSGLNLQQNTSKD